MSLSVKVIVVTHQEYYLHDIKKYLQKISKVFDIQINSLNNRMNDYNFDLKYVDINDIEYLQFIKNNKENGKQNFEIINLQSERKTTISNYKKMSENDFETIKIHNSYYFFFEFLKKLLSEIIIENEIKKNIITEVDRIISVFKSATFRILKEHNDNCSLLKKNNAPKKNELSNSKFNKLNLYDFSLFAQFLKSKLYYFLFFIIVFSSVIYAMFYYGYVPENNKMNSVRSAFHIPAKSLLFERPKLMKKIKEKIKGDKGIHVVALVGIGGAGKTVIARQYAREQNSTIVWEINAESKDTLSKSFEELAYVLSKYAQKNQEFKDIQEIKEPFDRKRKLIIFVQKLFKDYSNWVLLFDNVNKFEEIREYFPDDETVWGNGEILIITCNDTISEWNDCIDPENIIKIGSLNNEEKEAFFKQKIGSNQNSLASCDIKTLLEIIPPFPLDIKLATHYIRNEKISCDEYLKKMYEYQRSSKETRYGIIKLSLDRLISKNQEYKNLLLFISVIHHHNIPKNLFINYSNKNKNLIKDLLYDLKQSSFIEDEIKSFSMHQNIQDAILSYLMEELKLKDNNTILDSIFIFLKENIDLALDKEYSQDMKNLVRHCSKFIHNSFLPTIYKGIIQNKLGALYYSLYDYKNSIKNLEKSQWILNIDKVDFIEITNVLTNLGVTYRELGNYTLSQESLLKSLAIYEKHGLQNSSKAARALTHLGLVYKEKGDYNKSIDVLNKALKIYHKIYNNDTTNFKIALVQFYLGTTYRVIGEYEMAKLCLEEALRIRKSIYVSDHHRIAWILLFLGHTYNNLGNYKKAQEMLEESLLIYQKNLGENHVDYGLGLGFLGYFYTNFGQYEKAREYLEKSLNINKEYYGDSHIQTVCSRVYLGHLYDTIGEHEKAKIELEKSLDLHKKYFGENHLRVGWTLNYLGSAYCNLGDYKKAQECFKNSLEIYKKYFNSKHIEYGSILKNLGYVYLKEGILDKAADLLIQAKVIFNEKKHIQEYSTLEALAELYIKKAQIAIDSHNEQQAQQYKMKAFHLLQQTFELVKNTFPESSSHFKRVKLKIKHISL